MTSKGERPPVADCGASPLLPRSALGYGAASRQNYLTLLHRASAH